VAGRVIRAPGSPIHDLPFSPAMRAGNHVYVSGTVPVDNRGRIVGIGDVRAQTRCVLEAIRDVLQAAGASLSDVVFNQVFLTDLSDFGEMNEVYAEFFPENPPARYCVQSPLVRVEFLVEIAATAYVGG
jgi:aminoacrylate peracid reductase